MGHDHRITYTTSILPIILIGLTVTLKAAAAGFAIALILGLVLRCCTAVG